MEMKKLFSVLTSFMFLFVPVISKAMIDGLECIICNNELPKDQTERIKTECGCEFCKDHLIKWWESKEKEANDEGYEFLPICPRCHEVNSVDFYNSILGLCAICLKPMSSKVETIMTKCKHKFCKNCLNKWLDQKNTCPMCRTENPCSRRGKADLPEENNFDVADFYANLRELNLEMNLMQQRRVQGFEHIHDEAIPDVENKEKTLGNKCIDFAKDNSFLCALLLGGATTVYLSNSDGANGKPTDEEYDGVGSDFDYSETGLVRENIKTES